MIEQTTVEEAIEDAFRALARTLWTVLPARVLTVDTSASTVTVQPFPADYLSGVVSALPAIPDVPICWPRAGDAVITLPLSTGDFVLLLFSARSLARYRDDGSEGDPQSIRTHNLSDCVALPMGLWPDGSAQTMSATDVVINRPSGAKVQVGGTGGLAVARDTDTANATIGGGSNALWDAWYSSVASVTGTAAALTAAKATPIASTISATSTTVEAT